MNVNRKGQYIGSIVLTVVLVGLVLFVRSINHKDAQEPPTSITVEEKIEASIPSPTQSVTPTPTQVVATVEFETITIAPATEYMASNVVEKQEVEIRTQAKSSKKVTPTPTVTEAPKENKKKKSTIKYYEIHEGYGTYMLPKKYQKYTLKMCKKYGVKKYYKLMLALMWHESNYKVDDISRTNDYGLCQINRCNHSWLKKTLDINGDFLDPYTSIECGVYMMSIYLKKYDDVETALVAYNRGENAVSKNKTYSTSYSRTIVDILNNKLVEYVEPTPTPTLGPVG